MIYILHGDDVVSSRNEQNKILDSISAITRYDLDKIEIEEMVRWFSSQDLFAEKKAMVIENCSKISPSNMKLLLPLLVQWKDKDEVVILWNGERLTPAYLQKLKSFSIREFSLPKFFFQFLDNLQPKKAKELHTVFSSLSQTVTAEQIFYAMVKRIRLLLLLKSPGLVSKDLSAISPWQLTKLKSQSITWTDDQLRKFYSKLFELEEGMKTSSLPISLEKSLDLLLVTKLI